MLELTEKHHIARAMQWLFNEWRCWHCFTNSSMDVVIDCSNLHLLPPGAIGIIKQRFCAYCTKDMDKFTEDPDINWNPFLSGFGKPFLK